MKLTVVIALDKPEFWHENGQLNVELIGQCFRAVEREVGTIRDGVVHDADGDLLGIFNVTGQKPREA